jgi:hypothetical protein
MDALVRQAIRLVITGLEIVVTHERQELAAQSSQRLRDDAQRARQQAFELRLERLLMDRCGD